MMSRRMTDSWNYFEFVSIEDLAPQDPLWRKVNQIYDQRIETNMGYRWFLGLKISEKMPHFSTCGKNYAR